MAIKRSRKAPAKVKKSLLDPTVLAELEEAAKLAAKIDEYAVLCLQVKELNKKLKPLQKELKKAINQTLTGNLYTLTKKVTKKTSLDIKKIKDEMSSDWVKKMSKESDSVELIITKI